MKFELKGESLGEGCDWEHSEYLVKIENGKPKVYGLSGTKQEEVECPAVEDRVLGRGPSNRFSLKFPLSKGSSWSTRFARRGGRKTRWVNPEYKVRGWERVKTPKGEFEAFKLTRFYSYSARGGTREFAATYYYSPKVKAVISWKSFSPRNERSFTLIDFSVKN